MTNYLELALQHGGFTNLDRVYLENVLSSLTEDQKLRFITPPPSVINAYFSERYQKQGPEAATAYYFEMSCALTLFSKTPSFKELKPFVRLNLSGHSYGLSYESQKEVAIIFPEKKEAVRESVLLEIAQIFPHYKIFMEDGQIKAKPMTFDEASLIKQRSNDSLLSEVYMSEGLVKIQGFNQEEVLELSATYSGERYYGYSQRQSLIYITK